MCAYNLIRAGTHSLHLWGMHCVTVLYNCLSVSIIYSEAPLNDHLYKATTLEIRPLWFSPKSMYTCIMVLRIKTTLKIRPLHGLVGGLISEVPLYNVCVHVNVCVCVGGGWVRVHACAVYVWCVIGHFITK